MPLPRRLLCQGITDMVRISDARMSGMAYGTVVLHVAPEAAVNGTIAWVRTGDMIELSVSKRRLELHLSDGDLERRKTELKTLAPVYERGYVSLYTRHVLQADKGAADFDVLVGGSGFAPPLDSH